MSRFAQKAVALGSALTLAMSLVGSAFADSTTSGATTGTTPTTSTVVQQTTQTASNTAIVIQAGSATSGAAVAGTGSTAKSGEATTSLKADVDQSVNQTAKTSGASLAVAGSSNTTAASTDQTGSNTANLQQLGASSSGAAVATGDNAKATSGKAEVKAEASQSQSINQSASTKGNEALEVLGTTLAASSTTQAAHNEAVDFQTVAAASGMAVAIGKDATAETGKAKATAKIDVDQSIDQSAKVKATNVLGAGTGVVAAQAADQTAVNIADAAQLSLAASGPAVAIVITSGTDETTLAPFFLRGHETEAKSGDAESFVKTDQDQDIDQSAKTFVSMFGALDTSDEGGATGALAATGVTQLGTNTSIVIQDGFAKSGAAVAILAPSNEEEAVTATLATLGFVPNGDKHGHQREVEAKSGEAEVHLFTDTDQSVDQKSLNKVAQDFVLGAVVLSAAIDKQTENQLACVPLQDGVAISGDAVAVGTEDHGSSARTGEAEDGGRIFIDQGVDDPQKSILDHWQFLALEWPLFLGDLGIAGVY